jgi:hypothetical protein
MVTSAPSFEVWRREFEAAGIDVANEALKGALRCTTADAWRKSASNVVIMARNTLTLLKPLLEEFNGVRIIGDVEWDLDPPVSPGSLCHWEATANLIFDSPDVASICQYDVGHYAPAMIHSAIRTHPWIIWEGQWRPNKFYEARQILNHEPFLNESNADDAMVLDMLSVLSEIGSAPAGTGTVS